MIHQAIIGGGIGKMYLLLFSENILKGILTFDFYLIFINGIDGFG